MSAESKETIPPPEPSPTTPPAAAAAPSSSSSKKSKSKDAKKGAKDLAKAEAKELKEAKKEEKAEKKEEKEQEQRLEEVLRKLAKIDLLQNLANDPKFKKKAKDTMESYRFWKTQPVTRVDETVETEGPIEPNRPASEIRQEPYPLPKDFEWAIVNVEDPVQLKELYELLSLNYVEDDDAMFRFDYSAEFLNWALKSPGWKREWHIGVRVASNKKLVAFISGIPAHLRVNTAAQTLVEINFLCVHKKLRSKRLAPVLIKEVTRRVNLEGIFQAAYTAGVYLPTPVGTARYYHRSLNPKKLVETGFSHIGRNMTMARTIRLYKLPTETTTPGLRPMQPTDVPQVTALLNSYMQKFPMAPSFSEDEVRHWLLPVPTVVFSYVAVDPTTTKITDFFSFYSLPSSVIGHPVHKHINAAYLFYYAPKGLGADEERTRGLINDALVLAAKENFDVFNCLNLMHNQSFVDTLKFGKGDGNLHYYLYNYRCKELKPEDVALVLL